MTVDGRPGVAVLISGEGTNLQALIDAADRSDCPYQVVAVVSNRADARGLERARNAGIPALHVDPRAYPDRAAFDRALAEAIDAYSPRLVVLAGFMRILGAEFVSRYAGRMLNIHPSLLPKFKGLDTHRRVLEAGEREHGASVHFVTAELDAGPVVIQYRLDVGDSDTEASLSARVHVGEYIIYPRAVEYFASQRLELRDGRVYLDGAQLSQPIIVDAQAQ